MDKILALQSEIGVLSKTETNPFFKSKYFDINSLIAQLMHLLEKHGLTVVQPLYFKEGRNMLTTHVCDAVTGHKYVQSEMALPDLQDPQKLGSCITYYRRYALQSLFLLQAQDDDGNHASAKKSSVGSKIGVSEAILDDDIGF